MKGVYNFLKKNGVTISFALGAILVAIAIAIMVGGLPEDINKPDGFTLEETLPITCFDFGLGLTQALIYICAIVAILGGLYGLILNPRGAIKFGIITAALVILYFISIGMGAEPSAGMLTFYEGVDNIGLGAPTVAYIDGLLIFTAIIIFLAAAAWVFSLVWGFLKSN